LDFYYKAAIDGLNDEQRWRLWEEYYNFAAVPPGEQGKNMARRLFQEAWDKYQTSIEIIEGWEPNKKEIETYLTRVKSVLGYDQPIDIVIVYFVGFFEKNAFVAPYDGDKLALCLPIENRESSKESSITLSHELTHIVHSKTANLTSAWERSIGSTILQEGLATQVSKFLVPNEPDESYIEHKNGWLIECKLHRTKIVEGIIPYLKDASSEAVTKFTFGKGTANIEREAYFVGWEFVQYLLEQGVTFKEIASVQENNIPNYLNEVYSLLLG
jgi:hypothetical protein